VKYKSFCDFLLSYSLLSFFSIKRPARTARLIFTLYGSNDVVQPKDGPFGVKTMVTSFGGNVSQKKHQKAAWIDIFKPKSFLDSSRQRVAILYNGPPFRPLKLSLPLLHTWFLGPTRILNPNGISIGSAFFAQLTSACPYTL